MEVECVSCGLVIEQGMARCPGCGTAQSVAAAQGMAAACAVHPEAEASFTCARCGAFGCVRCNVDALGVCTACTVRRRDEALAQRRTSHRGLVASLCVCAVSAPAVAWLVQPGGLVVAFGVCSLIELYSVVLLVRRSEPISVVGVVFAGVSGIPLLGMALSQPWALVPLLAIAFAAVSVVKLDALDKELWRSRPRESVAD